VHSLLPEQPVLRGRAVDDVELTQMLISAGARGQTADFFGQFEYFFAENPSLRSILAKSCFLGVNNLPQLYTVPYTRERHFIG
jgi:hypothetical protein